MPLGITFDRLSFQGLTFHESATGLQVGARFIMTNAAGDQRLVDLSGLPAGLSAAEQTQARRLARKLIAAYAQQILGTDGAKSRIDATKDGMLTEVDVKARALDADAAVVDQFAP